MSEKQYLIPSLPLSCDVETKAVMKQTTLASRKLGELNGIVEKIPNPEILIRTLSYAGSNGFIFNRKYHYHS